MTAPTSTKSREVLLERLAIMSWEDMVRAYLDLLEKYEAADAFRQSIIDRQCAVERVNQAIQERTQREGS